MTPLLQIECLTKSFGDNLLFSDISFTINQGEKVGLIAQNGKGKSTLLRILAGEEGYDSGQIIMRKNLKVGYLPQIPHFDNTLSILQNVLPLHNVEQEVWTQEDRARQLLHKLGINDFDQLPDTMSRGQLKRAAIARVLLQESEMLIMDEPTNHLDIDMVEWIEKYLSTQKMTLLMVTHDRYFLDNVCNRILEIESRALYSYQGNYDYYLTKHDERLANRSAELVKVRNLLRKEQEWMRRQPQARGSKAKYRIDAFYDLKERSRQSQENDSVNPLIESSYIGSKIFEAYNVSKSYGDKRILNDWSYTFARYDKIGIVGGNGVGKTTFLRMLLGEEEPDSGHFDIGTTVKWGYYNQGEICTLDKRKKVIDAAREIAEEIRVNDKKRLSAAQFLNHFLFSVPDQQKYIYNLSGGELRRLNLAVTLMRNPNFLIFDEPTNDLDILTLSILEEYIANFKGCVIVVSHDRFFLDRIAEHIFVFRGDGVVEDFPGNYSQWRHVEQLRIQQQRDVALAKTTATASQSERQRKRTPKGLSYKENKEKEELEALLPRLETRRNLLEQQMSSGTLSTDELLHAGEEIQRIISDIDRAETRLLELMEKEESQ